MCVCVCVCVCACVCVLCPTGAGAYAGCTYCSTIGEYSKALSKMVYLNHRSFLPDVDVLRLNHSGFPSSSVLQCPSPKTMEYVDTANAKYCASLSTSERKKLLQETGCKGPYSLRRLPFHDRYLNTPVEPMHLLKNIAEHIVKLVSGISDSSKVRKEEEFRNRFPGSWVTQEKELRDLSPAPFRLQREELTLANNRVLQITVPHGTDWKSRQLFSKNAIGQMKSVEWRLVLSTGILKYCLRGLLGGMQRSTLFELCDLIEILTSDTVCVQYLDSVEYRVHRVLSLLERDFPISLHVVVFHLLHHLPMFVRRFGPIRSYWMYPMERFNSWISRRVLNRRYPEATVLATYRVFELTHFLELSGQLPCIYPNKTLTEDVSYMLMQPVDSSDDRDTYMSLHVQAFTQELDCTKLRELDVYYQKTDTQYSELINVYKTEKAFAKKSHSLMKFPPLNLWLPEKKQLTVEQLELRKGPARSIRCFRTYTVYRGHMAVRFSTESSLNTISSFDSSYIQLTTNSPFYQGMIFGRLQMIFEHTFNKKEYVLAYVKWFQGSVDRDSGLYVIDLTSSALNFQPIVTLNHLSRPLIHAIDYQEKKLWILNTAQSTK